MATTYFNYLLFFTYFFNQFSKLNQLSKFKINQVTAITPKMRAILNFFDYNSDNNYSKIIKA
jgi:hypothetical protein